MMSNLFRSGVQSTVAGRKKPNAVTAEVVVVEVLPAVEHLVKLTERLESSRNAAMILQTCANEVRNIVNGPNNDSEAIRSFSMNK